MFELFTYSKLLDKKCHNLYFPASIPYSHQYYNIKQLAGTCQFGGRWVAEQ